MGDLPVCLARLRLSSALAGSLGVEIQWRPSVADSQPMARVRDAYAPMRETLLRRERIETPLVLR